MSVLLRLSPKTLLLPSLGATAQGLWVFGFVEFHSKKSPDQGPSLEHLTAMTLKHIGTVKGHNIPQDMEIREQLSVLLRHINVAAQKLEKAYTSIEVTTAYREEDEED